MTQANAPSPPRAAHRAVWPAFVVLGAVLATAIAARLCIGTFGVGWPDGELAGVIWQMRLYRVALAVVAGAALSVRGVSLQALLRNPLAETYILGLSTGAAAGIMVQGVAFFYAGIKLGGAALQLDMPLRLPTTDLAFTLHLALSPDQGAAVLGAGLSMLIVYIASRRGGLIDPLGLLLTGVVLSTINGALVMMLNYMVGPGGLRDDLARWMMGYLDEGVSSGTLALVAVLTMLGLGVLTFAGRSMDVATLTASEAQSLGVNLARLRKLLFATASILAAGAVLLAGPLAFVGLICPHVARLLLGPRHGPLVIGAAIAGAALILLADTASAALAAGTGYGMMPIGIFTAMVGGPVFLWMMRPHLGRGAE